MSTKTGNPPVIDQTRVRITGADGEVVVRGEPGAVETSGDERVVAKVTNRSNGATESAAVNDDGSFEVRIEGTLDDDYELTATTRGTSDSTTVDLAKTDDGTSGATTGEGATTCLQRTGGTANEPGTRGPQPICGTLNAEASCLATEVSATVSLQCTTNSDCVVAPHRPDCTDSCGNGIVVSTQGATELAASLAQINETICADFDAEGCAYLPSGCPPPPTTVALCEDGQCVGKFVDYAFQCSQSVLMGETATCKDFETEARCQRDQVLANLSNTCDRDEDCEVVNLHPTCTENDCSGYVVIASASVADAEAGLTPINQEICARAADTACEYSASPCQFGGVPRCVEGACVTGSQQ